MISRQVCFEQPGKLHFEALLVEEVSRQRSQRSSKGVPSNDDIAHRLLRWVGLAPALEQGLQDLVLQGGLPGFQNTCVCSAPLASLVLQRDLLPGVTHQHVLVVCGATKDQHARLGWHEERCPRVISIRPADQRRVEEERVVDKRGVEGQLGLVGDAFRNDSAGHDAKARPAARANSVVAGALHCIVEAAGDAAIRELRQGCEGFQ
mmetsp:Transcript_51252/g.166166  ORF Transcript_51252/g.166166 Transcript_51252/m.166166 type:complete len:206 (+) Transcript_51252:871-1488(+)